MTDEWNITPPPRKKRWESPLNIIATFIFAWWAITILTNMGAPAVPEEPKFPPPKSWDERHPSGYEEWNGQKAEAVPLIRWPEETNGRTEDYTGRR